jgi:hypothetical protein
MTRAHARQGSIRRKVHRAFGAIRPDWHRLELRRWPWLAGCAAVALAVLATIFISSSHHHSAVPVAAASPADALASPTPPVANHVAKAHRSSSSMTPEAAVAAIHVSPRLAGALKKWDAGPGGPAMGNVSEDLGDALQDAGSRLYDPMRVACLSLSTAVTEAKDAPPVPDPAMQRSYALALTKLASATADCRAAISVDPYGDEDVKTYENPALLHKSMSELAAGVKDLYQATVDLSIVRHPGTRP